MPHGFGEHGQRGSSPEARGRALSAVLCSGHKDDAVEGERLLRLGGENQMADMHGIRPAEIPIPSAG